MIPYPGILSDALATGGTPASPPSLIDMSPAPYARKPSIVDRVAARLFPTGAYSGLLDPETTPGLSRQALLSLGTNLLRAGAPSENQLGFLGNLGAAYQGVDFPKMAEQALQLQQYRKQTQALASAAAAHPPKPGETPEDTYGRIAGMVSDLAGQPGTEELIGKLSNVLAQLRPRAEQRPRYAFRTIHENGQDWIYRINTDDPTDRLKIGLASPRPEPGAAAAVGVQAQETQAAAQNALASLDDAETVLQQDPSADIMPTAAAVARGVESIPGVGGMLRGAMEPIAQHALTPSQQKYQQAMDQFLHNYASVLPKGGRSVAILQNLRQSFTPGPGQTTEDVRGAFAAARDHLHRSLEALAKGQLPPPYVRPSTAAAAPKPKTPVPSTPRPPAYNPKFWHPQ